MHHSSSSLEHSRKPLRGPGTVGTLSLATFLAPTEALLQPDGSQVVWALCLLQVSPLHSLEAGGDSLQPHPGEHEALGLPGRYRPL